jgi:hypothetical protein
VARVLLANNSLVYTTPAPKGTLSNAAINGARRATENLSRPSTSSDSTASIQQRQSSAPIQQRPASSSSPKTSSPLAPSSSTATPTIRTSLVSDLNPPNPSYSSMSMQSPVMNETLSVINEHITDMSTPRTSYANGNKRDTMGSVYSNPMSSVYSNQPNNRSSFIAGHETDEEEHNMYTEEEVSGWSAQRVAEYLEDSGVERSHCDAFLEQEISGDVLLAMEQSSVFMKEFDLGPVGRRLRTWHKIKALQDEVLRSAKPGTARSTSEYSAGGAQDEIPEEHSPELGRHRSASAASALPRALSTRQSIDGRSSTMHSYQQPTTTNRTSGAPISPLQSMTSFARPESAYRPSAQNVRSMNHNRRHSSMGSADAGATARDVAMNRMSHRKQPSIDTKWAPGQAQINSTASGGHAYSMSSETTRPDMTRQSSGGASVTASPNEMEKGYFSATDSDPRSRWAKPNVLQKKSYTTSGSYRQDSGSSRDPSSPALPPSRLSDATTAVNSKFASIRTTSMPQFHEKPLVASDDPTTPMVTKLSYDSTPSSQNASSPVKPGSDTSSTAPAKSPPMASQLPFFITKAKIKGLRATSDAVTTQEKTAVSPTKEEPSSPMQTGSSTPSLDQKSIDMPKSATRTSTGSGSANLMPPPASTKRPQRKNKKETSAYTRGLAQKGPAEQIATADYSGWMKKKSGSLMTTWKPRLFVLKGRRLSYYYSENDTEEKGLIDISYHNVMVAHNEKLTGLHAAMTGASGPLISPSNATFTSAQQDLQKNPPLPGSDDDGLFIFKLVPPKSARGVTFTKPTVHYFAVNSRQEGRLWMAALMKAVIDREQDGVVTTTYNQKTISLAKARARKERPLAFQEESEAEANSVKAASTPVELDAAGDAISTNGSTSQGLGIEGLPSVTSEAQPGADRDRDSTAGSSKATDVYSTAPSSAAANGTDNENDTNLSVNEREAVAMSLHA